MMIHSFPHLIAGTGTQVAPPPASTGEPGYTCSAKYLFNLPIFQSLYFTAFQVMMIHSFPHLIAGTGAQVAPPPAKRKKAAGGKSGKGKCYSLYCSCFLCHAYKSLQAAQVHHKKARRLVGGAGKVSVHVLC